MLNFIENFLNEIKGNNGQDTDKAVRVLLLGGCVTDGSRALAGFFTTVKLD